MEEIKEDKALSIMKWIMVYWIGGMAILTFAYVLIKVIEMIIK